MDLIGSGLLFSGYRSSYKRRPLEAGLLGQDSLLVLDEAHLSKPFEKLVCAIGGFQKDHGSPMRVIRMSATSGDSTAADPAFTLQFDENGNLTGEDADDKTIRERFGATKTLSIEPADNVTEAIANDTHSLATQKPGARIVVFVRTPKQVGDVRKVLEKKNKDHAKRIAQLTGTMRGLERDELVDTTRPLKEGDNERRVMQRFLKPDNDPSQGECFLISTSAGEVGFDLNGDHMVCDATTIDSLIQRLGRVNRRGLGDAQVHLFFEAPKKEKEGKRKKLEGFELAVANTIVLLHGVTDVSPKNIAHLKRTIWGAIPEEEKGKDKPRSLYDLACSPVPTMVELTDILLDAWSMTSISETMPGRPEVGPWLRGIDDELPQTTIAWRAELELDWNHPDPGKALQRIFGKHPIRRHESITTNSYRVAEFLKQACKLKNRPPELSNTLVALRFSRGSIDLRTIKELADDPGILNAEPTLLFPATFGGLDAAGMLDVDAIAKTGKADDPPAPSLDVADHAGYEQREGAFPRLRLLIDRTDRGEWVPQSLPGGVAISDRLQIDEVYPTSSAALRRSPPPQHRSSNSPGSADQA